MTAPKASGAKIARRQLAIIGSIPVLPETTDTNRIRAVLADEGFDVTPRKVQRDLENLATWFDGDLRVFDDSPKRYAWAEHALLAPVARLTTQQVLLMRLVHEHLKNALPASMVKVLQPAFEKAKRQGLADASYARWSKKVRFEPIGYHPRPPVVRPNVQAAVYDALFGDKACRVTYRSQDATEDEVLEIEPVGLLVRDSVLTLVVVIGDEGRTRELRLDRMKSATVLERSRHSSATRVSFATYTPGGRALPELGATMRITMLVDKSARFDATARPFSDDQEICDHDAMRRRVTVTAPNSLELVAWLRGYGPKIEVLSPLSLRELFAEEAERSARTYDVRVTS